EVAADRVVEAEGGARLVDARGRVQGQQRVEVMAGLVEAPFGHHHLVVLGGVAHRDEAVGRLPPDVLNRLGAAGGERVLVAGGRLPAVFGERLGAGGAPADALAVAVPAVAAGVGHRPGDLRVVAVVERAGGAGGAGAGDGELRAGHVHDVPLRRDAHVE